MARLHLFLPAACAALAVAFLAESARADKQLDPVSEKVKDVVVPMGAAFFPKPKSQGGTGTAKIICETLTVDGTLTAGGLRAGGDIGNAGLPGTGLGGGQNGTGVMTPGGGAGFYAGGGSGSEPMGPGVCDVPVGAGAGGPAFAMPNMLLGLLGSAGGGSGTDKGGTGGGHLIILATTVVVNGDIDADGETRAHLTGFPGGGSGGVIEIHAFHIKGTGSIHARGGNGASNATAAGGGGAGGIIVLDTVSIDAGIRSRVDVSGGTSGNCTDVGPGEDGVIIQTQPSKGCIDADGDGFFPPECAPAGKPTDCNDSDLNIGPNQTEICDGVDNDCNNKIDDVGPDACEPGKECRGGSCKTVDQQDAGPMDAGNPDEGRPDHIDFEGGCDMSPLATVSGFASPFLMLAGVGLMLRRKRRAK